MPQTLVLNREDIDEILHYCHWIAAKRGDQQRFLSSNYPGWSMGDLMQQLITSKAVVKSRSTPDKSAHFSGYQVRARFTTLTINCDTIS
jgi:hypothetical protein